MVASTRSPVHGIPSMMTSPFYLNGYHTVGCPSVSSSKNMRRVIHHITVEKTVHFVCIACHNFFFQFFYQQRTHERNDDDDMGNDV